MQRKVYSKLVAIVGRPNVGKSSIFNRIIKERRNLVHDEPGVTRDRIFARAEYSGKQFYLCDTGGFEPASRDNIKKQLVDQAELAIEEAERIVFVVDGREGLHPVDADLIKRLRKAGKQFVVAVNKCDMPRDDYRAEEFRKLGVEDVYPISAEHARGFENLMDKVTEPFAEKSLTSKNIDEAIKFALIGRPNVGKSSLLNRLIGEQRSIVDEKPGTTRDTVDAYVKYQGRELQILDTAGIRRKSRMVDKLEKFSAFRSMTALEECDVAALVIDAVEGATESDARVAGAAFELRKPILIIVNKWDLIANKETMTSKKFEENIYSTLRYISYSPMIFVSALENQRVSKIFSSCLELFEEASRRVKTSVLNKALKDVLTKHTPPLTKNRTRRIKFLYASQVTVLPPTFVVFCSDPKDIHFSYKRFLENEFRTRFGFKHIPVSIIFRDKNKGAGKKHGTADKDLDIRDVEIEDDLEIEVDVESLELESET